MNFDMSYQNTTGPAYRSKSCSKFEMEKLDSDLVTVVQTSSSLPSPLCVDNHVKSPESLLFGSTYNSGESKCTESYKLVQNCGPECMITQRIVDKLLARMLHLENERSELLAANRSWAVQFQMMQENHDGKVKKLEEELIKLKEKNTEADLKSREKQSDQAAQIKMANSENQLNLLSHQVDVYREDFLEERKARVRAHAQIESLKNELKRERKARAKLSAYVQQANGCDLTLPDVS